MNSNFQTISVASVESDIVRITLQRENVANAFNTQMAQELSEALESQFGTPDQLRAIIVTGSGERAFCAGGDFNERNGMTDEQWLEQHVVFERMIAAVLNCPVPLIGAVNGAAYGGGCELVAAFDFCYAVDHARFAQTETKLGIIPGIGGTQNLSRAIGERRSKELIFTGKPFTAKQAMDWGLINESYPTVAELHDAVLKVARQIAGNAPLAVRQAKHAIHKGLQMSLEDGMACEIEAYNQLIPTADRREGIEAVNEKRAPRFYGK